MKYKIGHYYGKQPPVPEAHVVEPGDDKHMPLYEVEIDDLNAFVEKHGPIILSPPGSTPYRDGWWIWVTDHTGRFIQK
jgi:hypothetical protein